MLKSDEYGWHLVDGSYAINWYNRQQLPQHMLNICLMKRILSVTMMKSATGYDSEDSDDNKGF